MDDEFLLYQMKLGNKTAFKNLFDKYFDPLLISALMYCKDSFDAKELVQNTFIKFWEQDVCNKVESGLTLRSYLFKMIKNGCLDYIENKKRLENNLNTYSYSFKALNNDTEEQIEEGKENLDKVILELHNALKLLPSQTLKTVIKVYFEKKKQKQVAKELGLSPNTIRNQLVRGIRILKTTLITK